MKKFFFLFILFLFFSLSAKYQNGIFIIVPGTWSLSASWYKAESHFFKAFEKSAQLKKKHVLTFQWSGKTSYEERKQAAQNLAKLIQSYPATTEINIVAHSHGANVAIQAAQILSHASKKKKFFIHTFFALAVPVDIKTYNPPMDTIEFFYNLFSFNDFVQPVCNMYERIYPQHSRRTNLRLMLNGKEPNHQEIHSPLLAAWIPFLHDDYFTSKKNSFSCFSYQKDGILQLVDHIQPCYDIDHHRAALCEEDYYLNQKLPLLFIRKARIHENKLTNMVKNE